ncbi:ABC transporter permease [Spirosoma agri]|uniref:FtsX-like permease family protein n=1 Tax=Spirosoma agri TaxID=1987381 RepID=A0A6M0IQN4_9BACT|nr:ABC transporter permease [Spirosoma agri]NEU69253.1 FtsX-like permease family protein [Spirosoma agri]
MDAKNKTPGWANWLLKTFGHPDTQEEVTGDLLELYAHWVATVGERKARWRYSLNVLKLLRPFAVRNQSTDYSTPFFLSPAMIQNYVKIALRNLLRHKAYSLINIVGLALGMACSLLIGLWVYDELNYDRFLPYHAQIHYVRVNYSFRGNEIQTASATPGPLSEAITRDIPQVAAVTKLTWPSERLVHVGDRVAKEQGQYASVGFFDVFDLPAVSGNPRSALANLNQIVISQRLAEIYFPNSQAVGQSLQLDNNKRFVVGAVLKNLPPTSTLQFDWLVNFKAQEEEWQTQWGYNAVQTYLRLKPATTALQAEASMKGMFRRYATFNNNEHIVLQPITDLHLWGDYENGVAVGGQIEYVRIFGIVALFILLIACINFMNLSTARSAKRSREVGVRKVIGARRLALVGQFLSESTILSLLSAVIALVLVWLTLPAFNTLFDKQITLDFADPVRWIGITGLVLITGLLAGSYPALFLSGGQPARILQGLHFRFSNHRAGPAQLRQVLVVFQFALSTFLIVGMLVIGRQMSYLRTKHLGLDRGNVVYLNLEGQLNDYQKTEALRHELIQLPSVAGATTAAHLPLNIQSNTTDLHWSGQNEKQLVSVSAMSVGNDFIKTTGIKLLDGRDFRPNALADTACYLINEAAARLMGMNKPVGQHITFWFGKGPIIGLMKDFHLGSLREAIKPLVITYMPPSAQYLLIKPRAGQTAQALADLERLVNQFNGDYPFSYHFLDEAYQRLYHREQQVSVLINYFGILAILISCLGLFGLAAFSAEQRTKEIGIRKVLGASIGSLVALLSTDFLKLVLIAFILASPVAYYVMQQWLTGFAYRVELSWWVFVLAGGLAVGIALLTVSYQSIKTALMNPVKSLRSE